MTILTIDHFYFSRRKIHVENLVSVGGCSVEVVAVPAVRWEERYVANMQVGVFIIEFLDLSYSDVINKRFVIFVHSHHYDMIQAVLIPRL